MVKINPMDSQNQRKFTTLGRATALGGAWKIVELCIIMQVLIFDVQAVFNYSLKVSKRNKLKLDIVKN